MTAGLEEMEVLSYHGTAQIRPEMVGIDPGIQFQRAYGKSIVCQEINSCQYFLLLFQQHIRIFGYRAEQSIHGFCIDKKNWVMTDTIAGARFSAIIYSIAETAKANNLKPYDYFEYLLRYRSIWMI